MQQIAQRQDQAAGLVQNIAALQSQGLNLQQIDSSIKNWIDSGEGASLAEFEKQILDTLSSNQNLELLQNINHTGLATNIAAAVKAQAAHLEHQAQLQAACRLAQQELDKLRTQGQALEEQLQNMMQGDFQLNANLMQTTINIEQVAENENLEAYQAALEQAQQNGRMQLETYSSQLKALQQRYQQAAKLHQNLQGIFVRQNLQSVKAALQRLDFAEASRELQQIVQQTDDIAQLRQFAIFAEDFGLLALVDARVALIEASLQEAEAQRAVAETRQQMVARVTGMEQRLSQANVTGNLLNYKNALLDKLNTVAQSENIAERHQEISALDKEIDYLLQVQEDLQNTLSTEIDGLSLFLQKEEQFAKVKTNAKFKKGNKVAIEFSQASTEINKQIEKYNKAKQQLVKGSTTIATGKDLRKYANECQGVNKLRQGIERKIQQGLKKFQS
jgi:hypothetical protein